MKTIANFIVFFSGTASRHFSAPKLFIIIFSIFVYSTACQAGQAFKPVTVSDATDKSIFFSKPPRRIVVIGAAPFVPMHILYMFPEMKQLLAGYEQKIKKMNSFIELIDPDYNTKLALMSNPGIEPVAALKPDLVVAKGTGPGAIDRLLSEIGIPILYLNTESPGQFLNDINVIGKVLGNEKRAGEIIAFYRQKLLMIKTGLVKIVPGQKPRVLMLEYSNRGGSTAVRVPAQSWIQTIQVQKTGGSPVWLDYVKPQHAWQIVGFEQVAAWDPDKIFMVVWHALNAGQVMKSLKSDSKWKRLKAVESKNLFLIPQDIFSWDSPDPRWILGMLWMAQKMHPEKFPHIDMTHEVYLFFEQLYGMDKTSIESNILPKVNINGGS